MNKLAPRRLAGLFAGLSSGLFAGLVPAIVTVFVSAAVLAVLYELVGMYLARHELYDPGSSHALTLYEIGVVIVLVIPLALGVLVFVSNRERKPPPRKNRFGWR